MIHELSTGRVLTTAFVDGVKASDTKALAAAGIDRKDLAKLIITAYCQQIFNDRVYHADPHPGNLMVLPGPNLVFLDFGAVAEISPNMRQGMIEFVQGGLAADTDKIVHAMKTMGFVSKKADPEIFDRIVAYMHDRFKEEIQLDSFNLRDLKVDPQKASRTWRTCAGWTSRCRTSPTPSSCRRSGSCSSARSCCSWDCAPSWTRT